MTRRRLLLQIGLVLIILGVLVWLFPSNSDFKAGNPQWNGTADFLEEVQTQLLNSLEELPPMAQGTSLILIPYTELSADDLQRIGDYVDSGGRLILMDDFGFGNEVLEYLGVDLRFTGDQMLDPLFNYKNTNFPKVIDFVDSGVTSEVDGLVFNHATSLADALPEQVVAWSSYFSFLDENQNSKWDAGEPKGHMPVVAEFAIGEGSLIVVADPSILISSMLGMEDNRQLMENMIEGQVYLDQSHLPDAALDEAKVVLHSGRSTMASVWGLLGLTLLVLVLGLKPIWERSRKKNDH